MYGVINFTKVSSKGQVVIPNGLRKKMKVRDGDYFSIMSTDDLIILKKISEVKMLKEDLKTINKVKEAWADIEEGKFKKGSLDDLMKDLKSA